MPFQKGRREHSILQHEGKRRNVFQGSLFRYFRPNSILDQMPADVVTGCNWDLEDLECQLMCGERVPRAEELLLRALGILHLITQLPRVQFEYIWW